MAKVPYGINGPFIGRVGNTVGYILNGINVIRAIGAFHGEYTPKQLANHQRMGLISSLSTIIQEFLKFGFSSVAAPTKQGHTNHSISINKEKAVKGVYPNQETDFSKLIVAQGTVAVPKNPVVKVTNSSLEYSWEADLQAEGAENSDQIMLLAYFPESEKAVILGSGSRRTVEKEILEIPGSDKDRQVETYIAFVSDDRTNASNSVYLGQLIIPATVELKQEKPRKAEKKTSPNLDLPSKNAEGLAPVTKSYITTDGYSELYHFGSKYTEQTEKMRIVSPLLSLFKHQINVGFEHGDKRTTPFNKAVSRNINGAIGGGDRVYNIYFPALVFSAGKRESAWATKLQLRSETEVTVQWEVPKTAKMSVIGDDEPCFIFYNSTKDIACTTYQSSKRKDLEANIELSGVKSGDIIYAFMFFVAHDKKSVSNTDYLGVIEII